MQIEMHTLIKNVLDKGFCQRPASGCQGSMREQCPTTESLLQELQQEHTAGFMDICSLSAALI